MKRRTIGLGFPLFLMVAVLCMTGCDRSTTPEGASVVGDSVATPPAAAPYLGDPTVSAELGGPGFEGGGWTTAAPTPVGDPRAVKGGTLLTNIPAWPDNLRMYGIRSNTWLNYLVQRMCYQSLLGLDPTTLEFAPSLASHWQISDDKMTFTFRIDPRAVWSDGTPVTADDVIATYRLINDDTLLDPMSKDAICAKMEEPVARSKYLVEVRCKVKHWRNFVSMASMTILPAHEIANLTGSAYLDAYNFKYTAVSGPYIVRQEDIRTNDSITLTRRPDFWAINDPDNEGLNNIDRIRLTVIRDDRLAFDKALKGELDFYNVNTAKWWVEDLAPDRAEAVRQGHLVRRKVYTRFPKGFQGHAINMRKAPLDDVRVRKALAHLYDRRTMLEKFAYNEYEPLESYFPGSDAANPGNEMVQYDPRAGADLLAEAGWSQRGSDGILVKDGQRLSIPITYRTEGLEKYLTVYQESCKQAGVELQLELLDPETGWNNMQSRRFTVSGINWGAVLFPNPRTMWHSSMADKEGSNNFVGFQNAEADRLMDAYDEEFELSRRNELLRELDAIIFDQHPYVLDWYLPCERFIYWNKFGMPDTVLLKYHEWEDAFALWWVDPQKEQALRAARRSGQALEIPPLEVRPWDAAPADVAQR